MQIFIASDHAGFEAKAMLSQHIKMLNINLIDLGTNNTDSTDYPIYAEKLSKEVIKSIDNIGVLICGSGIGVSITANKIKGIRAALSTNVTMAQLSKAHNNANIICFASRMNSIEEIIEMFEAFLNAKFEGGRHQRRIDLIHKVESQ